MISNYVNIEEVYDPELKKIKLDQKPILLCTFEF
jgi:hypothetical protein